MARSLNKVLLLGNVTRDPEIRYTEHNNAVCSFGLATNRQWTTDSGEKKEDVEFHNIVCWNKLAELVSGAIKKSSLVYIEGRITNRSWEGKDGIQKTKTEIVADDVIFLDKKQNEN